MPTCYFLKHSSDANESFATESEPYVVGFLGGLHPDQVPQYRVYAGDEFPGWVDDVTEAMAKKVAKATDLNTVLEMDEGLSRFRPFAFAHAPCYCQDLVEDVLRANAESEAA